MFIIWRRSSHQSTSFDILWYRSTSIMIHTRIFMRMKIPKVLPVVSSWVMTSFPSFAENKRMRSWIKALLILYPLACHAHHVRLCPFVYDALLEQAHFEECAFKSFFWSIFICCGGCCCRGRSWRFSWGLGISVKVEELEVGVQVAERVRHRHSSVSKKGEWVGDGREKEVNSLECIFLTQIRDWSQSQIRIDL